MPAPPGGAFAGSSAAAPVGGRSWRRWDRGCRGGRAPPVSEVCRRGAKERRLCRGRDPHAACPFARNGKRDVERARSSAIGAGTCGRTFLRLAWHSQCRVPHSTMARVRVRLETCGCPDWGLIERCP
eukprot:687011-Prymnesium_polylepis.1